MKSKTNLPGIHVNILLISLTILVSSSSFRVEDDPDISINELYSLFSKPPAECKPFVRWWWNGDCIEVDELRRELDIMKAAGIGGVEINPIAHPGGTRISGQKAYDWLSPEWNQRLKSTVEMASERDMFTDLIMGSGWPFGGEFLEEDQLIQGVGIRKMELSGPEEVTLNVKEIWQLPGRGIGGLRNPDAPEPELFFLQMIRQGASGLTELTDLMEEVDDAGQITIQVPEGIYDLYIGTFQKAYRRVVLGAPGSSGPVVDHYDPEDIRAYMDRLGNALKEVLGGKLCDHIRALFCDSIELSGANITDDFFDAFMERRGYRLEPYMPLVYYHPYKGYVDSLAYSPELIQDIYRLRYDFNRTLVELFQERFIATFDEWANEHGMQSRYQAYGMPWLMGMLDGYRMVDIPESNNWLFSSDAKGHGYWIWNKYCASGAHLSGSRLVGCEAMTNTRGVFRTTLNMIKKNDDFNFITGINHTVLHGFNYSPPEAGFPGWVRFGAYFSEQNTWWPYFPLWAAYNSRLSVVFQHAEPVVDVAILTPEADIWQRHGLNRQPYYMNPWYHHDLWEGFSRAGIAADYINEGVIQRASAKGGIMQSENCSYQLVIVSSPKAMEPETLKAIRILAQQGVRFIFVDHFPDTSPGFHEKEKNDEEVRKEVVLLKDLEEISLVAPPADSSEVTSWAEGVIATYQLRSTITLDPVSPFVYTAKYHLGKNEIFFLSNQNEEQEEWFQIRLDAENTTPWIWDPETGKRSIYPFSGPGTLAIRLQPLESMLLVLEESSEGDAYSSPGPSEHRIHTLDAEWKMEFIPAFGESFVLSEEQLMDFAQSSDPRISSFAGNVRYSTSFELEDSDWAFLDLGVMPHISEVTLNGHKLGIQWYGRHLYPLEAELLRPGTNELQIRYTTTLANYANSLKENRVARSWIRMKKAESMGLQASVRLLGSRQVN
jgi:hypothetical protein